MGFARAPSSLMTRPLTRTRPSRIKRSAERRDAIPACARIFWSLCNAITYYWVRRDGLSTIAARDACRRLFLSFLPGRVAIPTIDARVAIEVGTHPDSLAAVEVLPTIRPPLF